MSYAWHADADQRSLSCAPLAMSPQHTVVSLRLLPEKQTVPLLQGALRCKLADVKAERDCAASDAAVLRRKLAGGSGADAIPLLHSAFPASGLRLGAHVL